MGSKKLKGIVFYGNAKPEFCSPQKIKEFYKEFAAKSKDDQGVHNYKTYGTTALVSLLNTAGAWVKKWLKVLRHSVNTSG